MRLAPVGASVRAAVGALLVACNLALASLSPTRAAMLGANKFDLMLDYLAPSPPPGADPEGYRRVRRAMGQKAIADARDAGLRFFRVAVTGYSPVEFNSPRHDLSLWQSDPPAFWAALDRLFDDLDAAGLRLVPSFVWNIAQFPALAGDSVGSFVRDPHAASHELLAQFLRDFIGRYRARSTILFYEMGNEMNLLADIDEHKRNCRRDPCVWGNFTTPEMTAFARDIVALIKSLDPARQVASGYSLPRPSATHLEHRPEFAAAGPDWTRDTAQEFARDLLETQAPFEIISVHAYPGPEKPERGYDPLAEAARTAHRAGKKLFIGEFGDETGATPYIAHVLDEIVRERIDFAAIWVWEFYQFSTYTPEPKFNVEPGYTDDVIALLSQTAKRLGNPPPPAPVTPRVVLTWPLPCATIDRPLELAAVASDGARPAAGVEFLIDGKPLGSVDRPPYHIRFDPAGRPAGRAEIEARAVSASGTTASFKSRVRLNGDAGPCASD